jgi:hypothetical protein
MRHREIRLIGPLRGEGELFAAEECLGRVRYDLEESEHVVLTQGPEGTQRAPGYREIQGSLKSLDGVSLLDRQDLRLCLKDGRQVSVSVAPPHRHTLARSSYVVQQIGVLLPLETLPTS